MSTVILRREHNQRCPNNSMLAVVRNIYHGECQRNHAICTGGFAQDGCKEFTPGGEEGTPQALFCGACGCHKNYHRREIHIHVTCHCNVHLN